MDATTLGSLSAIGCRGHAVECLVLAIANKWKRIAALERQQQSQEREAQLAKRCQERLVEAQAKCVSGDPAVVLHQYQQWLLRRAEEQKDVTVSPGTIIPEDPLGWRVKIELEGKAELAWTVQLIEDLESLPLLHRISFLRINKSERGNSDNADFAFTLEALVCKGAEALAQWPKPNSRDESHRLARLLAESEPFTRGYLGEVATPILTAQVAEQPAVPPTPKVDALSTLCFVGSVTINQQPMAWVVDSRTQQEMYVAPGGEFAFDTYRGTVANLQADQLTIHHADGTLEWQIGESLRAAIQRASTH